MSNFSGLFTALLHWNEIARKAGGFLPNLHLKIPQLRHIPFQKGKQKISPLDKEGLGEICFYLNNLASFLISFSCERSLRICFFSIFFFKRPIQILILINPLSVIKTSKATAVIHGLSSWAAILESSFLFTKSFLFCFGW